MVQSLLQLVPPSAKNRKAIDYTEQALVIFREIGNRGGEASGLGYLGIFYGMLGESKKKHKYQEQALQIFREIGDREKTKDIG